MTDSCSVDMTSLEGYAVILKKCGHSVQIFTIGVLEINEQRVRSAQYVFTQYKQAKPDPPDDTFDEDGIDLSYISDKMR